MNRDQPILWVLVGVPASGKTSWAVSQNWFNQCAYVSTDKHVEEYANSVRKTYSSVFESYMPTAVRLMVEDVDAAKLAGRDIIWYQTSTTISSRSRKLLMLPNYYPIAVVFTTPEQEELDRRLNSRSDKVIPADVVKGFIDNFEPPTVQEGFKEIWHV